MNTNHSLPMVLQLTHQLQTIKKGNATCAEYLKRIQQIADHLQNAGVEISEQLLVFYTLKGLGQEFETFVTTQSTQALTMVDVHKSLLIQEVCGIPPLYFNAQPPVVHHAQPSDNISVTGQIFYQKPQFPSFESAEIRNLIEALTREIFQESPDVKWENIKGLENAKFLLKKEVQLPIRYPKKFTGLLSPSKGVLLFGPPGTGKTMLAKAVATECKTKFFDIFASPNVRGWRGDPEKLVKVVFELARNHAPSIIFLDEIDSIINEHSETSQHFKTELLIQMGGLAKTNDLVFVLAATNLPWELDAAILRRLEKRILVPLPEPEARCAMFEELLPITAGNPEISYKTLAERTGGYSGSDIRLVCKEAIMQPLRRSMAVLEARQDLVQEEEFLETDPVKQDDVDEALTYTRPSENVYEERYQKFNQDYGTKSWFY